jgi:flavin reductase (DIM6/NTAB) family NADH-FMN oxidoreductase RutF
MEIHPGELPWKSIYKLLISSILPRPIGWISTTDNKGRPNLAPFSFFNVVCANPPTVLFCPGIRESDRATKDTLINIQNTGEFVINIVTEALAEAMVLNSAELSEEIDEFDYAKLEKQASVVVKPPRVARSPIHFECRVSQIIEISREPGGGAVVIGDVVHIHIDPQVLIGTDKINPHALKVIGRMGGPSYCRTHDLFDIQRPPSKLTR